MTSIRLSADLLEKASAFGLNVSKICEAALQNEVNKLILNESIIVPKGIFGISKNSRIIMSSGEVKNIRKIKVRDKVLSYNLSTDRLEDANVLDVGPLTSENAFATSITIENAIGTKIELLPDTKIFCWPKNFSEANWISAKDIRPNFSVRTTSHKRSSGSTLIVKVKKNHVKDVFYRLEVYPNNSFFANSNPRRKFHYINDYMPSVWGFPIKGYLGQIGTLLEQSSIRGK